MCPSVQIPVVLLRFNTVVCLAAAAAMLQCVARLNVYSAGKCCAALLMANALAQLYVWPYIV